MENIKKFLSLFNNSPKWLRVVVAILVVSLLSIYLLCSCGTPKTVATVQNVNPNSTVTVTMSVSNATTSTPSVDASIPIVDDHVK